MNEAKKVDKADKVRKAIFITIRKDSSRLTDKAVRDMYGSKVMEMIIKRAKLAKSFDEIIVCTTTRDVDDEIEQISLNMGVKVFRGSLMDKLERWNGAAKEYGWLLRLPGAGHRGVCRDPAGGDPAARNAAG